MTTKSWVSTNCKFAKKAEEKKRVVVSDPSILGVSSPYIILTHPVSSQGGSYLVRFIDPMTMRPNSKTLMGDQLKRLGFSPYAGEPVGADLEEQSAEKARVEKREQGDVARLMPPTPRIVSKDVGKAQAQTPEDQAAAAALAPLAGQRVMAKGLPDGSYEATTPKGPVRMSEAFFRQVMLAPDIGETAGNVQKKFERDFGTTENMKKVLPTMFPNLAAYVNKGLVKVLDSSKIFANYREGLEGGDPAGEGYFKNDVRLFGGNPDDFLAALHVDWKTPNKRLNAAGNEEHLRGYYSPQVVLLPDRTWLGTIGPEAAQAIKEQGGVPSEVLDEAESIASRNHMWQGYKPYPDGGVYFNSTDLFRYVLGLSSGQTRDIMTPSSLPGGSLSRRTWKKRQ